MCKTWLKDYQTAPNEALDMFLKGRYNQTIAEYDCTSLSHSDEAKGKVK